MPSVSQTLLFRYLRLNQRARRGAAAQQPAQEPPFSPLHDLIGAWWQVATTIGARHVPSICCRRTRLVVPSSVCTNAPRRVVAPRTSPKWSELPTFMVLSPSDVFRHRKHVFSGRKHNAAHLNFASRTGACQAPLRRAASSLPPPPPSSTSRSRRTKKIYCLVLT